MRSPFDLPPAALARHVESLERRRTLARALHEPPPRPIEEQLAALDGELARYQAAAVALYTRLVAFAPVEIVRALLRSRPGK